MDNCRLHGACRRRYDASKSVRGLSMWLKSFIVASLLQVSVAGIAHAKGPFGSVNVGNWIGGAFSNDETGAFSHCAVTTPYANGVILVVSQNAAGTWSLAFASPGYHFNKGENAAIDVTFDGREQARLYATAYQPNMLTAIMPLTVVRTFQKSSLMVATAGRSVLNFDLTSTGSVIAALANCVTRVKADGLDKAGDFTKGAAKPAATTEKQASPPASGKSAKSKSGTGFVVSGNGHIVTNHHVIDGCGDLKGNLTGEAAMALRVVSSDANNDLALLQAPSTATFKEFARIRDRSIRSGDSVVAIGFPYRGLLSSDFTVTTGIVSLAQWDAQRFAFPADQCAGAARQQRRPAVRHHRADRRRGHRKARQSADCGRNRKYPREYQLRHQDRRTARFPRQFRCALSDRGAEGRASRPPTSPPMPAPIPC